MFTIPVSTKGWHHVACNCAEEKSFRKMLTFSPAQLILLLKQMFKTLPEMCWKVHLPPDFSQEAASSQKLRPSSESLAVYFPGTHTESHPQMFHGSQMCPPGLTGHTKPNSLLLHLSPPNPWAQPWICGREFFVVYLLCLKRVGILSCTGYINSRCTI